MSRADVVIDFDSLAAAGNPSGLSGSVVTNYFASYSITLSGVTAGTAVTVLDARVIYSDIQPVVPTSPFNVIAQAGSLDPISYTLNFAVPQSRFSFTRTAVRSGVTGVALPEWHAFAYDGQGSLLGTVGENAFSIFSDLAASTYVFAGPISSVKIASDNHHFAAFGSVILDNFVVSTVPVPEPSTIISLSLGGSLLLGLAWRRRWRAGLDRYDDNPRSDGP